MIAPVIGYVGMTHLGLCSAIAAASKGFVVRAVDRDATLVGQLNAGKLPVVEPGLEDLLAANRASICFSSDATELSACDVIYVAPDVPTNDIGKSDLAGLDELLQFTLENCRRNAIVIVLSQVPPGYTRARQQPGRQLLYQVETLIFGRAVERAVSPERFIVGCPDPATPLPAPMSAFLAKLSAVRSCRCASKAPNCARSPSTAASCRRFRSPIRWLNYARASAPTGPKSSRL
jgi:UDPglucose 6-dehydrogenase